MQGRGNVFPHSVAGPVRMPTSIIGRGCAQYHTGVAQAVTFSENQDFSAG